HPLRRPFPTRRSSDLSVIAGMRIAVVVKQVPAFTEMALDEEGRLIRAGLPLELNPYCRRAVAQAVELACAGAGAGAGGGAASVTDRKSTRLNSSHQIS